MTQTLFYDLLLILAAGLIAALICRWLQVSVLIGYLVAGVILGQGTLHWITDDGHQIEQFAEAGVFLLLFSIGLEFSIDDLRRLGKNLFIGGAAQMALVVLPVAGLLIAMRMPWQTALLIGSAIAFSSTVLVFKALSECGHSAKPHGSRAIGILLFQDAALIPLLLLVPLLTGTGTAAGVSDYVQLAVVSTVFVAAIVALRWGLAKWLIPMFARYRSPELIILFTIVLLGGVILVAEAIGLPPAIGAFAAGLIFNGNRWSEQIDSLVLPFRETFAAIFFVSLGLILDPLVWWAEPWLMTGMLIGVVVLKGVSAAVALKLTGLPMRDSIGMGIGMAHVGEFAFVLVLLGTKAGIVTTPDYQRVVTIAVGSLILTPPILRFGLRLTGPTLTDDSGDDRFLSEQHNSDMATVIGAGLVGRQLVSQLELMGRDVCLIDLSPMNLHPFATEGFRTIAGDATRQDILKLAAVDECSIVLVCLPDDESALRTVRAIRKMNPTATLIVRCRYQSNLIKLRKSGADQVVSEETEVSIALLKRLT